MHRVTHGRLETRATTTVDGKHSPLIRFLLDDEVYHLRYETYLREFADDLFHPDIMSAELGAMYTLTAPYFTREVDWGVFATAVNELVDHSSNRHIAIQDKSVEL